MHAEILGAPSLMCADYAQEGARDPWNASDIADELLGTLRNHYAQIGMSESDPEKANYLALRGTWNAMLAPIIHAVENATAQAMWPSIRAGATLLPPVAGERTDIDGSFSQSYGGEQLTVIRSMNAWHVSALEWFMDEVLSDSRHWCRPI